MTFDTGEIGDMEYLCTFCNYYETRRSEIVIGKIWMCPGCSTEYLPTFNKNDDLVFIVLDESGRQSCKN